MNGLKLSCFCENSKNFSNTFWADSDVAASHIPKAYLAFRFMFCLFIEIFKAN